MTWNGDKEECQYTKEGCKRAECPANKYGTWTNNECRCRYKRDSCDMLECPLGKKAAFTSIGCTCQRIPNFRPAKTGMCGPGKRWSLKKYACKPWKGCGPGRKWSNEHWKCKGTLSCPAGTKWSGRVGKCLKVYRRCLVALTCPIDFAFDRSICACKKIDNCPKHYRCSSPLMRWDRD